MISTGTRIQAFAVKAIPSMIATAGTSVHISNGVLQVPKACALMISGTNISFSNVSSIDSSWMILCEHSASASTQEFDAVQAKNCRVQSLRGVPHVLSFAVLCRAVLACVPALCKY